MPTAFIKLGLPVVADSTNPVNESRALWRNAATLANAPFTEIEVICSNLNEHQQRIEQRVADIAGLQLPTWQSALEREYHSWETERIIIDTAGKNASSK